jgi:hypothetical protein
MSSRFNEVKKGEQVLRLVTETLRIDVIKP